MLILQVWQIPTQKSIQRGRSSVNFSLQDVSTDDTCILICVFYKLCNCNGENSKYLTYCLCVHARLCKQGYDSSIHLHCICIFFKVYWVFHCSKQRSIVSWEWRCHKDPVTIEVLLGYLLRKRRSLEKHFPTIALSIKTNLLEDTCLFKLDTLHSPLSTHCLISETRSGSQQYLVIVSSV